MNISVTRVTSDETAEIVAIADECGLSHWSFDDYAEEASRADSVFLAARIENESIAGFLAGRFVAAMDSDAGIDFELYNIGVIPERQTRGLGSALMNALIAECEKKNASKIWLEVRASNRVAIRFYDSFGFSSAAIRPEMYRDPVEDGVLMNLNIK